MARTRIDIDRRVIGQLLKSEEVFGLRRRGRAIATAAGPGHRVDFTIGRTRALVIVATDTFEAMEAEATDRNLSRALYAGKR